MSQYVESIRCKTRVPIYLIWFERSEWGGLSRNVWGEYLKCMTGFFAIAKLGRES